MAGKKTKAKIKIVLIILLSIIVLMIAGRWAFCVKMYNDNFNIRGESYEPAMLRVEDFEGLECTEYSFPSDKGQKLAGYLYSNGENQHAIVIFAHGFGDGTAEVRVGLPRPVGEEKRHERQPDVHKRADDARRGTKQLQHDQPSRRLEHAVAGRQRLFLVGEIAEPKRTDDQIKGGIGERGKILRIARAERDARRTG